MKQTKTQFKAANGSRVTSYEKNGQQMLLNESGEITMIDRNGEIYGARDFEAGLRLLGWDLSAQDGE